MELEIIVLSKVAKFRRTKVACFLSDVDARSKRLMNT
jgi:hypothetical protein